MSTERDYKNEYQDYHGTAEQKKRRASRNAARRELKKRRKVLPHQDIDHKDGNPLNNSPDNLRVVSRKFNRSRNKKAMVEYAALIRLSEAIMKIKNPTT